MTLRSTARVYHGASMRGTFRPGDRLIVHVKPIDSIRAGDILVFRNLPNQRNDLETVHRVVQVSASGWITQGDNEPAPDRNLVTAERLVGEVVRAERNDVSWRVAGGVAGRIRGLLLHRAFAGTRIFKRLFFPIYRTVRDNERWARLWRARGTRIVIRTPDRLLVKLTHPRRGSARRHVRRNRFAST